MKRIIKIRERKDRGKWEVDFRDHQGKRYRPLFDSEQEALHYADEKAKELSEAPGPIVDHQDITLRDYAALRLDMWKFQLAPRTIASYEERLRNHVLPTFGDVRVRDIRRRHVNDLLNMKQRKGHNIRVIRAVLSSLLTDAADDEIIASNPCLNLTRKKRRWPSTVKADREIRPLSRTQRDAVLAEAARRLDRRIPILFELLAKTGARPNEALALWPDDIDFKEQTVRIERGLDLDRSIRPTKTYETRTVDLTLELSATLKRYLPWLTELALRRGWGEVTWLFPNDDRKPFDEPKIRKVFTRTLKRVGLPAFRLYDLRHTCASLLLAEGAPLTYVAQQLGHRKPTTTLKYYARWIPGSGRRWINLLDSGGRFWNQEVEPRRTAPAKSMKLQEDSPQMSLYAR